MTDKKKFSVFVHGVDDSTMSIPVADSFEKFGKTTIADLKGKIHERRSELEPDRMRLLFAGKQLEDARDGDYNLRNGSTVQLVLRLPGGDFSLFDSLFGGGIVKN